MKRGEEKKISEDITDENNSVFTILHDIRNN